MLVRPGEIRLADLLIRRDLRMCLLRASSKPSWPSVTAIRRADRKASAGQRAPGAAVLRHGPPFPPSLPSAPAAQPGIAHRAADRRADLHDRRPRAPGRGPWRPGHKLSAYPRSTFIPTAGTWLGSFDAGLAAQLFLSGRHGELVNPYCGVPLRSVINDGLYEGHPADLTASCWNPAIFLDPEYWQELHRRNALQGNPVSLDSYRQDHPARFPLKKVPSSAECEQSAPAT